MFAVKCDINKKTAKSPLPIDVRNRRGGAYRNAQPILAFGTLLLKYNIL